MARMSTAMLTADEWRRVISYDPATGEFTWLVGRKTVRPGDRAGTLCQGYIRIQFSRKCYAAHRIAWLLSFGEWPACGIDHINGQKHDNRISNLRLATYSQNGCNRGVQRNTLSRFKGVYPITGTNGWFARIEINGRKKYLGAFKTRELAADAYA